MAVNPVAAFVDRDDVAPEEDKIVQGRVSSIRSKLKVIQERQTPIFEALFWRECPPVDFRDEKALNNWPQLNSWNQILSKNCKDLEAPKNELRELSRKIAVIPQSDSIPEVLKSLPELKREFSFVSSQCQEMLTLVASLPYRRALACFKMDGDVALLERDIQKAKQNSHELLASHLSVLYRDIKGQTLQGKDEIADEVLLKQLGDKISLTGVYSITELSPYSLYYNLFRRDYYKELKGVSQEIEKVSKAILGLEKRLLEPIDHQRAFNGIQAKINTLHKQLFAIARTDHHKERVSTLAGLSQKLQEIKRKFTLQQEEEAIVEAQRVLGVHLNAKESLERVESLFRAIEAFQPVRQKGDEVVMVMERVIAKKGPLAFALTEEEKQVGCLMLAKMRLPLVQGTGLPRAVRAYIEKRIIDLLYFPHDAVDQMTDDRPYDLELQLILYILQNHTEYKIRFHNTLKDDSVFQKLITSFIGSSANIKMLTQEQLFAACDILYLINKAAENPMKDSFDYAKACAAFLDFCHKYKEGEGELQDLIRLLFQKLDEAAKAKGCIPLVGVLMSRDGVHYKTLRQIQSNDARALCWRALCTSYHGTIPGEVAFAEKTIKYAPQQGDSDDHKALFAYFKPA